jgi:hypothetical protein
VAGDGDAGGIYAQALVDLLNRVDRLERELRETRVDLGLEGEP